MEMLSEEKGGGGVGKIIVLTFSDEEDFVVNRILDSLTTEGFSKLEISTEPLLTVGGLTLYPEELRVEYNCHSRFLGHQQFAILYLLAHNSGKILRKSQIYSLVWEGSAPIHVDETIRYHISEIRKVLAELTGQDFIETVRGIGYRFNNKEEQARCSTGN